MHEREAKENRRKIDISQSEIVELKESMAKILKEADEDKVKMENFQRKIDGLERNSAQSETEFRKISSGLGQSIC